jgi:hypothetical protein
MGEDQDARLMLKLALDIMRSWTAPQASGS